MVRENHHIIDKIYKRNSPKYSFYDWQAINLVKAGICIGMLLQFNYGTFFQSVN